MRTQLPAALLATAVACSVFAAPAQALRARVFVASYGTDSGTCSFSAPCRSLNFAYNAVLAGGEITMIDSAGFEPLTINKALTITSPAGVEAGITTPSGGNAITVSAGLNDAVVLRGLTLDGGGIGYNGIVFNAGGRLTVTDCVVQNFHNTGPNTTGNGILIQPTSGAIRFVITNTIVSNNGYDGIFYVPPSGTPTANGVIDHVVATGNDTGVSIVGFNTNGAVDVAISNSIVSNNNVVGISVGGGIALTASIDNTTVNGNEVGIVAEIPASVLLSRSVIQGNTVGTSNNTSNTFYTYGNNLIDLNGNNFAGSALNTSVTLR